MAVILTNGNNTGEANVISGGLSIRPATDSTAGGAIAVTGRADDGGYTTEIADINPEVDSDYRWRTADDSLNFQEPFAGSALNTSVWLQTVTTMTGAVSDGFYRLNSGNSVATNAVIRANTWRTFPMARSFHMQIDFPLQLIASAPGIANTTWEIGLFVATGTAAPTDGVFLRMSAAGVLTLVATYNNVEIESAPINYTSNLLDDGNGNKVPLLVVAETRFFLLVVTAYSAQLWCNNQLITEIGIGNARPSLTSCLSLPFTARIYNGAIAPLSSTQLLIGNLVISLAGQANPPDFSEAYALSEAGAYQAFSGMSVGQTAQWANSVAPSAASLSNTVAGYTTLGGLYAFNAPAGATTDYVLFAYSVPAAAANTHGRNLVINGITITAINVGAAVATTATVLLWGLAVGSSAASLATNETATSKAPRRTALGVQGFVVGAAIGTVANTIQVRFDTPLLAEPGTFVQVIVRVPVGTATASQSIQGTVTIDGEWA